MKEQVLRGFDGNPAIDPDPTALTLRLNHWLSEVYNHTPHEGLKGQTPSERWDSDERDLQFPEEGWERAFTISFQRTVSNDNIISHDGTLYEVPRGAADDDSKIMVTRHLLEDNALTVVHQGKEVRLHPVDLAANARARRAPRSSPQDNFSATPPRTAAAAQFEADFEPLVDADGGYQKGPDDE
jgi:hypothetical protein